MRCEGHDTPTWVLMGFWSLVILAAVLYGGFFIAVLASWID